MSAPGDPPRLPHAAPFLLVDRVLEIGERSGAFLKLVTASDPCVGDDGRLPAAFVLEALAHACGALVAGIAGGEATPGYLAAVDDFRMHGEVRAGDALRLEVDVLRNFSGAVLLKARALVEGELRAEGRITLKPPR
jgi:UDP-3-O-[3-hydroxymyristoyl] N-acetylglucosamine deacetylase/3-hydroxyacyl-[acyl-carrier-protein] dehydratase